MKKYKAPGADNIQAELLRYGDDVLLDELQDLYRHIWEEEKIPNIWRKCIITIVPKSGDLSFCSNNRGITILSVSLKLFNRILIVESLLCLKKSLEATRQALGMEDPVQNKYLLFGNYSNAAKSSIAIIFRLALCIIKLGNFRILWNPHEVYQSY